MSRNILITGATGSIATLIRPIFQDCNVFLISRRSIKYLSKNETNIICPSIEERNWWLGADNYKPFDQIFHLAELVKKNVSVNIDLISRSHIEFLNWACINSRQVTYPLTAYLYDIGRSAEPYVKIKRNVLRSTMQYSNIFLPIVHPVVDFGVGLNRLRRLENKIPFVNMFCAFSSTINIVESKYLGKTITLTNRFGLSDIYSDTIKISKLFGNLDRKDFFLTSLLFKNLLLFLSFLPPIYTLLKGRVINHDKIF